MESNEILEIVSPVLYRICDYYIYEQNGYELRYEEFSSEMNRLLSEARQRAEKRESLNAEFRKIEFPLIFFIDYTVKESGFAFSRDYVPMAHSYNELSGDDKFFDLLDRALSVEKDPRIITLYYIMLGLGFDGAYKREPVEVIKRMQACAGILGDQLGKGYDAVCIEGTRHSSEEDRSWSSYRSLKILCVIALITMLCFALNLLTVHVNTAPFRNSIYRALRMASPSQDYLMNTPNPIFQAGSDRNPGEEEEDDAVPGEDEDFPVPLRENPESGSDGNSENDSGKTTAVSAAGKERK